MMEFIINIRTNFQNKFIIRFAISLFSHLFWNNFSFQKNCKTNAKNFFALSHWRVCCQQYDLLTMQILYCVYFSQTTFSYINTYSDKMRTGTMMLYYNPIHRLYSGSPHCPNSVLARNPTQVGLLLVFILL